MYEKNAIGRNGEEISIVFSRSRETQESTLSIGVNKRGDPRLSSKEQQAFSTENENPFRHYEPNFKQTSVFIQRFLMQWSYADIAKANDISKHAAVKIYYAGVQKLKSVIDNMDAVKKPQTPEERKKRDVEKQKRYLERNRDKVNARRREHYRKNKERINAKRREQYAQKKPTLR
ncbi:hypothetical protein ACFL5W_01655 [Thermodesulfobacteriota bacterium]